MLDKNGMPIINPYYYNLFNSGNFGNKNVAANLSNYSLKSRHLKNNYFYSNDRFVNDKRFNEKTTMSALVELYMAQTKGGTLLSDNNTKLFSLLELFNIDGIKNIFSGFRGIKTNDENVKGDGLLKKLGELKEKKEDVYINSNNIEVKSDENGKKQDINILINIPDGLEAEKLTLNIIDPKNSKKIVKTIERGPIYPLESIPILLDHENLNYDTKGLFSKFRNKKIEDKKYKIEVNILKNGYWQRGIITPMVGSKITDIREYDNDVEVVFDTGEQIYLESNEEILN